jgi:phospholipase C
MMKRAVLLLAFVAALFPAPAVGAVTTTPIKHFITLMQENHSFDNYFGTYPGANGLPPGLCMPRDPGDPSRGCVKPFHLGNRPVYDLSHSAETHREQFRNGRMDGFIKSLEDKSPEPESTMAYYDGRDLPFYWSIADNYVLYDRFFTSAAGGSVWNHMYWAGATPGNPSSDSVPPEGFGNIPLIFDRLEEKNISWKFYVQNYDPRITFRTPGVGDRGSQIVWVPPLDFARYIDDPDLFAKIVDLDEYYKDLEEGTLPAVSFIAPSGASEHPPGSIQAGERFVKGVINALMQSSHWKSSAFMWTYDDWGGWYDHVPPPRVDAYGYGFRAPALLVSPYARRGHIDSTTLDFTSMLKFIEDNWGLEPLSTRDARANSIASGFDFTQEPRSAQLLGAGLGQVESQNARRWVIYVAYAFALAVPALLLLAGWYLAGSAKRRRARAEVAPAARGGGFS